MLGVTAASGLLTAESVIIVALTFSIDRARVPEQERFKEVMVVLMMVSYLSALACLHAVTFPGGFVGQIASSKVLFNISMAGMTFFILAMLAGLFPKKVNELFK